MTAKKNNPPNPPAGRAGTGKTVPKPAAPLTLKQQEIFVQEYLVDLNATRAAKAAGYSEKSARSQGNRLLTNADIQKAIQKAMQARMERTQVTQDKVVLELARIGFGDLSEVMSWGPDGITLKNSRDLTPDQLAAIAEISETKGEKSSSMRVKRHDKVKALELLGKHLAMFTEKINLNASFDIERFNQAVQRVRAKL